MRGRWVKVVVALLLILAVVLPDSNGVVDAFGKSGGKKTRKSSKKGRAGRGSDGAAAKKPAKKQGRAKTKSGASAASDGNSAKSKTDTLTFELEHTVAPWGDDAYVPRGTVEVKISQRSKQVRVDSSQIRTLLTEEETAGLRKLAEGRHFYRLRMPSHPGSNRKVVASIPACALFVAGFEETLWLHMDLSGNLVSFDYATTSQVSSHCSDQVLSASMEEHDDTIKTQTSVVLARPRQAHRVPTRIVGKFNPPPGLEHLRKVSKEEQEKAAQPGFFRKCECRAGLDV
eukprot:g4766.t1